MNVPGYRASFKWPERPDLHYRCGIVEVNKIGFFFAKYMHVCRSHLGVILANNGLAFAPLPNQLGGYWVVRRVAM